MVKALVALMFLAVSMLPAAAQEPKPTIELRTEYLMTIELPLDPPQAVGPSRRLVNIPAGGAIRGPKIHGTVIAPSGDWLVTMADGSARMDARVTIKTDDNAVIFMEYSGVNVLSKEAAERVGKGEAITNADGYLVSTPRFTTASPLYAWLNHIQAVGKMISLQRGRGITYDIFEIK